MTIVSLIPCRKGSTRVPGKNMRRLGGVPLLAYTIQAARDSDIFSDVIVCTDDHAAMDLAWTYNVRVMPRDPANCTATAPDILWVKEVLGQIARPMSFSILRPTSPFRTADTIRRAYAQFREMAECGDSIRAVERVRQHPYKMWRSAAPDGVDHAGYPIRPLFDGHINGTPWHSQPTQNLPVLYVQNSSLEMSWTANVEVHGTISGRKVAPFFTEGSEGFSIDYPEDWDHAERLIAAGVPTGQARQDRQVPACVPLSDASGCP